MDGLVIMACAAGLLGVAAALWLVHQNATLQGEVSRSRDSVRRRQGELDDAHERLHRLSADLRDLESRLRDRQQRFDILFNNARDMIFIHGVTEEGLPGRFVEVNDMACEQLEHSRTELLKLTPLDIEEGNRQGSMIRFYDRTELVALTDAEMRYRQTTSERQLVTQILNSAEVHYERTYVTGKGARIPVEVRARSFDLDGRPWIISTARDISERRKSERALREGQQRLRDLLVHSPIGLAMYDGNGRLIDVNRACLNMFGSPDQEAFGHINLFDNPFLPSTARNALAGKDTVRFETVFDFDEVKRLGLFVSGREGQAHFDILMINLGLDTDFSPKGYLFQVQDISEQRRAEKALREKEKELHQSQKLEAIGSLASGIAHDFNNILTPIMGYTELILQATPDPETLREYMTEMLQASHRAKDLINQILQFSRRSEQEDVRLRVSPIIKEVVKLTQASASSNVKVRRQLGAERDTVRANPVHIHQVFMNLCANAVHAMGDTGGTLEISTSNVKVRQGDRSSGLEQGLYLRVSIRDTGCGIDEPTRQRIFEPFFTTKPPGEGTGMGLAVVHGIVTGLGGDVTLESVPGEGSVFHVLLPVTEEPLHEASAAPQDMPRGKGRVLVVDDEAAVCQLMARMLETLGYGVETMLRPRDALSALQEQADEYDLLVTDQVMPGMTGAELARAVLARRPGFPVVLCTGFSEKLSPEQASEIGIAEFVMKPVNMGHLAGAVRRAMNAGGWSPG